MGTHSELMNLQGHYYQLHKMQFEMQESEASLPSKGGF
jgi:hypothetical protein